MRLNESWILSQNQHCFAFIIKNLQSLKYGGEPVAGGDRQSRQSLSNVLLRQPLFLLPSFAVSLSFSVCLFLWIFCIFVQIFFFCLFLSVVLFFCVRILSFGGNLSCQQKMLNRFSSQRPCEPVKVPNCAFCNFLRTLLFLHSSTLSVIFQVNGIHVELCTHKEVVSTEVIYYFPCLFRVVFSDFDCKLYFHLSWNWLELSQVACAVHFFSFFPRCFHLFLSSKQLHTVFTYSTQISKRAALISFSHMAVNTRRSGPSAVFPRQRCYSI